MGWDDRSCAALPLAAPPPPRDPPLLPGTSIHCPLCARRFHVSIQLPAYVAKYASLEAGQQEEEVSAHAQAGHSWLGRTCSPLLLPWCRCLLLALPSLRQLPARARRHGSLCGPFACLPTCLLRIPLHARAGGERGGARGAQGRLWRQANLL